MKNNNSKKSIRMSAWILAALMSLCCVGCSSPDAENSGIAGISSGTAGKDTLQSESIEAGESSDQMTASGLSVSEGLEFKLNADEKSYSVSGIGTCTDTAVVIPAEHDGLPVTEIGWKAFYDCETLRSVTIPDSVTRIGDWAFSNCSSLTNITIPSSVTSIGDFAFHVCETLRSVTIPSSVTSIGYSAFDGCSSLTNITIPSSVTSIGDLAFIGCSDLASITVEKGNSVYHSAGNCLIETASKTLIAGCKNSVIPSDGSVTSIGNDAFSACSSLTDITIPDSVTSIGSQAFYACRDLTSITIPNSVINIDGWAFSACSSLTDITISSSVTSIGNSAFYDDKNLATVTYEGTAEQWDAIVKGLNWDTGAGDYTLVFSAEK